MEQARVAVCHAFGFTYKRQVSHLYPFGIYTIPEVGSVGLSEEARQGSGPRRGRRPRVLPGQRARQDRRRQGRRSSSSSSSASTKKLIGCHCIGERATELVHIGQSVMLLGGTVDAFIEMVFNYPTLSRDVQIRRVRRPGRHRSVDGPTRPNFSGYDATAAAMTGRSAGARGPAQSGLRQVLHEAVAKPAPCEA